MKTQIHPPKYFRQRNVLFLSPHYLWRKEQFVHFLDGDDDTSEESSDSEPLSNSSQALAKRPAKVDDKKQYWHQFYD